MYIKYDSLDRHENLTMLLCNPGSVYSETNKAPTNVVGAIINASDEELVLNFNQVSELNFRVTKVEYDNQDDTEYSNKMYRAIQPRRLIYITGIGYFIISSINDGYSEEGVSFKDVRAESVEGEIKNRKVPYIADGTYRFLSDIPANVEGLADSLVKTLPSWRFGYVDNAVASRYRTFEDVDTKSNILGFMLEEMQDAYECIFLFDNITRTINVYDQNNYIKRTNIHLTKDDLIRGMEISESSDDLYTALSVYGDDDTTIAAVNPLGTSVIYDFSHYLDWMSTPLRSKVIEWQNKVKNTEQDYYKTSVTYYGTKVQSDMLRLDIDTLNTQIKMYQRCRDNIVAQSGTDLVGKYNDVIKANGGDEIVIHAEISETLAGIDQLIRDRQQTIESTTRLLEEAKATEEANLRIVESIRSSVDMSKFFSDKEYAELYNYVFEGTYSDEYIAITDMMGHEERLEQMRTMYERAKKTLSKASRPTQEYSIDTENFLFVKEFEEWGKQLETGCIINIELDNDDIAPLFLSNITVNYEDHTLSLTFGNRLQKFDPKSLFEDVLGKIDKSANTISYIKDILHPIKDGEINKLKEALATSRDLTMRSALTSTDEDVVIDESGYTGRKRLSDGSYDPQQVKITGKTIVFTDDAWETSKVAIGELILGDNNAVYGVNAQAVIGDLIVGNALRILNKDGKELFTVVDDKISSTVTGKVATEIESKLSSPEIQDRFKGENGKDGKSISQIITYYKLSTSKFASPYANGSGSGWSRSPLTPTETNPYLWSYTVTTYSDGTTGRTNPAVISLFSDSYTIQNGFWYKNGVNTNIPAKGQDGASGKDGANGQDGIGIKNIDISYTTSLDGTQAPNSGWQSDVPTPAPGEYLWTKTTLTLTDNTFSVSYGVSKVGVDGNNGADGIPGKDGVGVKETVITYCASSDGVTPPKEGWINSTPMANAGEYIWTRTVWKYTDDTSETGYSVGKIGDTGEKGEKGKDGKDGQDGVGINSTEISYASSSDGTNAPVNGWQEDVPHVDAGQYLWTKTKWIYTDDNSSVAYSVAKIGKDGNNGADGVPGKDGAGIKSTTVTYATSTNGNFPPYGGWKNSVPTAQEGEFVWTKMVWHYTDGTSETGYSVGKIGERGAKGQDGKDGNGIQSTTVTYGVSDSNTVHPSSWVNNVPNTTPTQYLWTRTVIDYTDPNIPDTVTYTYTYQGRDGVDGRDGDKGQDGTSVTVTKIEYQAGNSPTVSPTGSWSNSVVSVAEGQYLWTKTTFSDGQHAYGVAKQGQTGPKGADGRSVVSVTTEYASSTSGSISGRPSSWFTWATPTKGEYFWTRNTIRYSSGSPDVTYSVSYVGSDGATGQDGRPGKDGTKITGQTITYGKSTNGTDHSTVTSWTSSPPNASPGDYIWTKTVFTYSDGTSEPVYSVGKIGDTGEKGKDGKDGQKGEDGKNGISFKWNLLRSGNNLHPEQWVKYVAKDMDIDGGEVRLYNPTTSGSILGYYRLNEDLSHLVSGEIYTISLDVRSLSDANLMFDIAGFDTHMVWTLDPMEDTRISWTGRRTNDSIIQIRAKRPNNGNESKFVISNVMVEKGNNPDPVFFPHENDIRGQDAVIDYTYLLENGYVSYGANPPTDTNRLWVDANTLPRVLKRFDGAKWVAIDQQLSEQITNLEQSMNEFKFTFASKSSFEELDSQVKLDFANIEKYIRFVDGEIHISERGNPLNLVITNKKIIFKNNDAELAWFSGNKLFVTNVEVTEKLIVAKAEIRMITDVVAGIGMVRGGN